MIKTAPKRTIAVVVGLLLASALYLIWARGSALMLDLSALAGMFCL